MASELGRSDEQEVVAPMLFGTLRTALIFGSAAVAFALIAAPIAARQADKSFRFAAGGLDNISTGSIARGGQAANTYTIRRSVLQETPSAVCIIRSNGARSGSC